MQCPQRIKSKKFIKEEYGLTGYTVSSTPEVVVDYNGYEDEIWTVSSGDEWGTEFEVLVDTSHSTLGKSQALRGNYYDKVLTNFAEGYALENLELEEQDYEGYSTIKVVGTYSTKDDLKELFDEVDDLRLALKNDGISMDFSVVFRIDNPLRDRVVDQPDGSTGYQITDGDFKETFSTKPAGAQLKKGYSDAVALLVRTALDYQLEDCLAGLSEDEISEILENECRKIGIVRDGDEENAEYYEGMCANGLGYGISFGSLYKVLVNEGFAVDGDAWHYTFTGPDGDEYEISYDFVDELLFGYEEDTQYGYYYLKNGEVVPMRYYFYNHFNANEVSEMTGLTLVW